MKAIHNNKKNLINDLIMITCIGGSVAIALKFITYFNHWVYFPAFPNMLDSIFLVCAVTYLTFYALKGRASAKPK